MKLAHIIDQVHKTICKCFTSHGEKFSRSSLSKFKKIVVYLQIKWNTTKMNAEQRKTRMLALVPQVNNFKKQVQNFSALLDDLEVKAKRINGDEQKLQGKWKMFILVYE